MQVALDDPSDKDQVPEIITVDWLKNKLSEMTKSDTEKQQAKHKAKMEQIKAIKAQRDKLGEELQLIAAQAGITGDRFGNTSVHDMNPETTRNREQDNLLQQLRTALGTAEAVNDLDMQKNILKQFLLQSNKQTTPGGVSTLKPELLKKLTGEQEAFSMEEWLAWFNKQEQGECDIDIDQQCKHSKCRSGMLDKATVNIQQKEIWAQKNLLEDWADEDIEFKQMQFEHYVAGEARTIETCTDPAQILGRLKLLRRMAYAKLRGYDWVLIRKMYAAILTSIEAKENRWDSNFDRFEAILYRRPTNRQQKREETHNNKKMVLQGVEQTGRLYKTCSPQGMVRQWTHGGGQNSPAYVCGVLPTRQATKGSPRNA